MTRYLAIDQATKLSGIAIFDDDKLICSSTFSIPANKPIEQRLNSFAQKLNELYANFEFDYVLYEGIQLQAGNVSTYQKLAYIQAIIIFWCYNNDIKFAELPASHWRKVLKDNYGISFGRKREDQKNAAIKFVKEHCGIDVVSDEADAICLGIAGIKEYGNNKGAF